MDRLIGYSYKLSKHKYRNSLLVQRVYFGGKNIVRWLPGVLLYLPGSTVFLFPT
jgi:hypothetical protein